MSRRTIERPVTKTEHLNRQTPKVTRCAWPGCGSDLMAMRSPVDGSTIRLRVGILCLEHADQVADAVLEDRVIAADFFHHEVTHERFDAKRREEDRDRRAAAQKAADAKLRGDAPGLVYYLQVGERIKIGYSADVRKRMRAFPPGSEILAVEPGSMETERQRHQQFAGILLDGREWFRPDPVLLEHIATVAQQHSDGRQFAHHYRSNRGSMRRLRRD